MSAFVLHRHSEDLVVGQIARGIDLDGHLGGPIHGVLETAAGKTVIASAHHRDEFGANAAVEGPFRVFEVQGPLDVSLTGVLASILNPLAEAGISVFTLSTFDTDWILVPSASRDVASATLQSAGHTVVAKETS